MENRKFYSLTYKTDAEEYTKLEFIQTLERLKTSIERKESVYGLKCEVNEVCGTLHFSWFRETGERVKETWSEEMTLPVYASEERFS